MDTQISPQVRLVAIAGLVLALLAGGAMMVLNRRAAAEAGEPLPPPAVQSMLPPVKAATPPATKEAAAPAKPNAKPAAATPAPTAEPAPKPKPKPKPAVAPNGLPMSIASALQRHEVVVVSLFAPGASVDELAIAEARAGAKAVGAGFVALNATDRAQGGAFARLVGVNEPPAVFVYRNPDTLVYRLDGFADLDTVAQAAANARS